jgi:hypothetical protein
MRVGRTGVEAVEVGCRVHCQVAVAPNQSPQVISPGVVRELADLPQQQPVLRVGEHQLQDTPNSEEWSNAAPVKDPSLGLHVLSLIRAASLGIEGSQPTGRKSFIVICAVVCAAAAAAAAAGLQLLCLRTTLPP